MKKLWMEEVARSALQTRYYGEFRYAKYRKAIADMCYEITIPDDRPIETCKTEITGESLGRYMNGYHNKETGQYYYTKPRKERRDLIDHYLGKLPNVLSNAHKGDVEESLQVSRKYGYDKFAVQKLLAGSLRGTFYSEGILDDGVVQLILQVHFLKGEKHFRIRLIMAFYVRGEHESFNDLDRRVSEAQWDDYDVIDGFASTGTNNGQVFSYGSTGADAEGIEIGNYAFFEKGRRILSFEANFPDDIVASFSLITKPKEIALANALLFSIPE